MLNYLSDQIIFVGTLKMYINLEDWKPENQRKPTVSTLSKSVDD